METLTPDQQTIALINQNLDLNSDHGAPVSRASKLATELAAEKRRLQQDLRELQAENDDLKPTTPTGTVDWYVKWIATILSVSGIFLMSAGFSIRTNSICGKCRRLGFRRHRMERPCHHDRQFYKRDRGVANFGKNP